MLAFKQVPSKHYQFDPSPFVTIVSQHLKKLGERAPFHTPTNFDSTFGQHCCFTTERSWVQIPCWTCCFLCGVLVFSSCLCKFVLGTPVSSPSSKPRIFRLPSSPGFLYQKRSVISVAFTWLNKHNKSSLTNNSIGQVLDLYFCCFSRTTRTNNVFLFKVAIQMTSFKISQQLEVKT